jgi:hypothetical protein
MARSTEMASVGLPFSAMFHWYRSFGGTLRKTADELRSWVRTWVVAERKFWNPRPKESGCLLSGFWAGCGFLH